MEKAESQYLECTDRWLGIERQSKLHMKSKASLGNIRGTILERQSKRREREKDGERDAENESKMRIWNKYVCKYVGR